MSYREIWEAAYDAAHEMGHGEEWASAYADAAAASYIGDAIDAADYLEDR